jgi:hypothetical protein
MKIETQSLMHLHVLSVSPVLIAKIKSTVIPAPKHHTKKVYTSSEGKGKWVTHQ